MTAKQPNIVWFITDDTSDEMLGYAGGNVLTPHIDSIAREGVVCTQYHTAAPTCCPSRYSYLTGLTMRLFLPSSMVAIGARWTKVCSAFLRKA